MAYKAPVRDLTFILSEVLEIDRYTNQPGFQDVSSELAQQILEEAGRFADEIVFLHEGRLTEHTPAAGVDTPDDLARVRAHWASTL